MVPNMHQRLPTRCNRSDQADGSGETKWYVDFDKYIPYFVDYKTCDICLVVCPWSRPGVANNLLTKMARRCHQTG